MVSEDIAAPAPRNNYHSNTRNHISNGSDNSNHDAFST